MAITDIFSSSFLFSVAIIIILIGGLFAFINYRMAEQDHKLNSMIGLVSSMANETQFFRSKIHSLQEKLETSSDQTHTIKLNPEDLGVIGGANTKNLINVSDDEDYEDEDEDSEEDSEEDSDDEEDDDEEVEDDDDEEDEEHEEQEIQAIDISNNTSETIKVITLMEEIPNGENKSIHLENDENGLLISNNFIEELNMTDDNNNNLLSSISINDLGEIEDQHSSKNEYKKLPLNKLREIVVSKGLTTDASKLKKNEILKLLGEE
jgi:hypothetical protein